MFRIPQERLRRFARFGYAILLTFAITSACLLAQVTSGTISGTVSDNSGAVVSNAAVTVSNPATGVERKIMSSGQGQFSAPNLPPGDYTITVEAAGFKKLVKSGFILTAAGKLDAGDLMLDVGASDQSVTVSAEAGQVQLQASSGERSDLISNTQLNNVAINGRNVLDYMKLIPGVSSTFSGSVSGTGGIDGFNVNGSRANQHEFTIDGASNVDTGNNGGTHVTINPDAIEEVKVLTSNYQAEFGKAAGGQVAIVSKGGTNQWHGNVRLFHRHEGLNANEWFNKKDQLASSTPHNDPQLYRYNDVGYQVGGPLKKDKVFVFWSQEFYRQLIPIGGVAQLYVPTAAEREGDFSQSTDGDGNPVVITGPGITNNMITSGINPAMQQILKLFPLPNVSGFGVNGQNYNYSQALSGNQPRREDILRVDYQLTAKHRLFGRWLYNAENDTKPFLPFPGPFGIFACATVIQFPGGCTQKHPGWNFSANLISTITPTILNEFSVGPSHTLTIADGANGNTSLAANNISLPLLYPSTTLPDMNFGGLNNVNFQGSYLGATPWRQANTTINVNDNLSWVRGAHTFKAGFFYQRSRKDQIAWGNLNGQFSFNTGTFGAYNLGDPIAAELLGFFQSFDQSTARPTGFFRYNQAEFYVQDTWKVNQRLTLDYGMRFAWIPPQYDAKNQIALFDPAAYDPAKAVQIDPSTGSVIPGSGDPLNGMKYTASGQLPDGGWNSRGIMPEPRVGFAYDIFNTHKTVIRGGFGMMHDRVQGNLIFNTVFNNPAVVQTAQVAADNVANLPALGGNFGNSIQGDKNIIGADIHGQVPTVYTFSFGIQHELDKNTTLDVAYVGSQSRHLTISRDINSVPYAYAFSFAAQDPNNYPGGVVPAVEPGLLPAYSAAGYNYSGVNAYGHPSYTNAALVPYKGYGQISYLTWDGNANYNSLQASLQRRFSKGVTFGVVYTWSKTLAIANDDGDYVDPFNPSLGYRTPDWDRTHVFAANYVYDIPNVTKHFGGPKWLSYVTDNYQLSGVTQFMTGSPVRLGSWSGEPGAFDGGNMWGIIPFYYTLDSNQNFVTPPVGTRIRGSVLRTGGMQNWDMSLFKNVPLGTERLALQLRLEAFNVFNHPNFNDRFYPTTGNNGAGLNLDGPWQWQPGTPFSFSKASNWGQNADTYNNSGGPGGFRVLQLGAKFIF